MPQLRLRDGNLIVNDNNVIRITAERDPKQISWDSQLILI